MQSIQRYSNFLFGRYSTLNGTPNSAVWCVSEHVPCFQHVQCAWIVKARSGCEAITDKVCLIDDLSD